MNARYSERVFLEALRILLVAYLLVLALAACLGAHRALLSFPFYLGYSVVSFVIHILSLGRFRLAPRAKVLNARKKRQVATAFREWKEKREEEKAIRRGEELPSPVQWVAASPDATGELPASPLPTKQDEDDTLPTLPKFEG